MSDGRRLPWSPAAASRQGLMPVCLSPPPAPPLRPAEAVGLGAAFAFKPVKAADKGKSSLSGCGRDAELPQGRAVQGQVVVERGLEEKSGDYSFPQRILLLKQQKKLRNQQRQTSMNSVKTCSTKWLLI
ncbi:biogenesis of lysosome-related organelles complex 1 subunit 2 isoform X3 [Strix uralensis]|uniref:biogenesis of lysosome-related organelles complex 1 subunit 2 isoform X3 n=1 Tax=Strix uralensis TaxID=36305 RepID=UPI003DA6FAD7